MRYVRLLVMLVTLTPPVQVEPIPVMPRPNLPPIVVVRVGKDFYKTNEYHKFSDGVILFWGDYYELNIYHDYYCRRLLEQ